MRYGYMLAHGGKPERATSGAENTQTAKIYQSYSSTRVSPTTNATVGTKVFLHYSHRTAMHQPPPLWGWEVQEVLNGVKIQRLSGIRTLAMPFSSPASMETRRRHDTLAIRIDRQNAGRQVSLRELVSVSLSFHTESAGHAHRADA
jgi:hypothetical protein